MEPCTDLEQRADAAAHARNAACRLRDPGQDLEQGGLTCTVAADDSHDFTLIHVEAHTLECPEVACSVGRPAQRNAVA
jgi:hypothetical protein